MTELNNFYEGYIAGLTDGEGSFNVTIQKSKSQKLGFYPHPRFEINMHEKETKLMEFLKSVFPFGKVFNKTNESVRKKGRKASDTVRFYVWGIVDCQKLIEFFTTYQLICKSKDFELWKKCIEIMKKNKHLTRYDFLKICKLRDKMNKPKEKKLKTYRDYFYFKKFFEMQGPNF